MSNEVHNIPDAKSEGYTINVHRRWLYLKEGEPRLYSTYEIWKGSDFIVGYPTRREAEENLLKLQKRLAWSLSKGSAQS